MHSITGESRKLSGHGGLHAMLALLLAMLLGWGANSGHAAGEETIAYIHADVSGNPLAAMDEN